MEFAEGIGIGVLIAHIVSKRKKRNAKPGIRSGANLECQRRQKADEELITVILPTISNDK